MSKYKVGNKVVLEISRHEGFYGFSGDNNTTVWIRDDHLDRCAEPLYTYTEPLEAKIRRQAAEITRLVADNKRLKAENGNGLWNIEQARAEGQNEAWELAKKIVDDVWNGGYSEEKLKQIFGNAISQLCIVKNTYSEAAAKVAEWEKAKEKIKVGDVLEGIYDNTLKCVVTNLYTNNTAYLVFDDGTAGWHELDNFKKTGRHIDIDSFLKQIGAE